MINIRRILFFDLDGTLLRSDKTISPHTLQVLKKCREKGLLTGIATARSEKNSEEYIAEVKPDIIISCGGALVKYKNEYVFKAEFPNDEVKSMIKSVRELCGDDCIITLDTINAHYWNHIFDSEEIDSNWGESIYTDYSDFSENALKICFEIFDPEYVKQLFEKYNDCKIVKFSDSEWYMFTKKSASKENAVLKLNERCGISPSNIIAFGDDFSDIGMLKLCGKGIAMGNSIDEVKNIADLVIDSNDNDGIAKYLEQSLL